MRNKRTYVYDKTVRQCSRLPKIRKIRKRDKNLEKITPQEAEREVFELYRKITTVMNEANKPYKTILPGFSYCFEQVKIKTKYMVEEIPNHRTYPIDFPEEIDIWSDLIFQGEYVFEIKVTIKNTSKDEKTPLWVVKKTNIKDIEKHEKIEQMKPVINSYIQKMKVDLNKNYLIRQFFQKEKGK